MKPTITWLCVGVLSPFLLACGVTEPIGVGMIPLRAFVTASQVEPSTIPIFCDIAAQAAGLHPVIHPISKKKSTFLPLVAQNGIHSLPISADNELTDLPGVHWETMRGELLFADKKSVLTSDPEHPLDVSEFGITEPHGEPVWTGINVDDKEKSAWLAYKCTGWPKLIVWSSYDPNDSGYTGTVGSTNMSWLGTGQELPCNKVAHIYCFETFDANR